MNTSTLQQQIKEKDKRIQAGIKLVNGQKKLIESYKNLGCEILKSWEKSSKLQQMISMMAYIAGLILGVAIATSILT